MPPTGEQTLLETVLRRERLLTVASLAALTLLCWAYLVLMWAGMQAAPMDLVLSASPRPWTAPEFVMMFLMWAVMMVGMMIPSAAPMVLLFVRVHRQRLSDQNPGLHGIVFTLAYLMVWTGFSLAATGLQWGLEQAVLLSPMMETTTPSLAAALLAAAGVYQWTPLKHACLENCRAPVDFLSRSWRPGTAGALVMGLHHGTYCMGCCWVLMGLLFVGGVMNLIWVAAIAGFVLLEKLAPRPWPTARISGAALLAGGLYLLLAS